MLDWVLATLVSRPAARAAGRSARSSCYDAGESQLLPLMDENVARFPMLKLFSLPSFMPDGGRRIELGVQGRSRRTSTPASRTCATGVERARELRCGDAGKRMNGSGRWFDELAVGDTLRAFA